MWSEPWSLAQLFRGGIGKEIKCPCTSSLSGRCILQVLECGCNRRSLVRPPAGQHFQGTGSTPYPSMDSRSRGPLEAEQWFQAALAACQEPGGLCDGAGVKPHVPEPGLACDCIILISSWAPGWDEKWWLVISAVLAVTSQTGESFRLVQKYTLLCVTPRYPNCGTELTVEPVFTYTLTGAADEYFCFCQSYCTKCHKFKTNKLHKVLHKQAVKNFFCPSAGEGSAVIPKCGQCAELRAGLKMAKPGKSAGLGESWLYLGPGAFLSPSSLSVLPGSLAYSWRILQRGLELFHSEWNSEPAGSVLFRLIPSGKPEIKQHIVLHLEVQLSSTWRSGFVPPWSSCKSFRLFFSLEPRVVFNVGNKILVLQLLKDYLSQLY